MTVRYKIRAHPENASKSVDHILFNNILPTIDSTGRVDERIVRTNTPGQGAQREKTLERPAQMYWRRELWKFLIIFDNKKQKGTAHNGEQQRRFLLERVAEVTSLKHPLSDL